MNALIEIGSNANEHQIKNGIACNNQQEKMHILNHMMSRWSNMSSMAIICIAKTKL